MYPTLPVPVPVQYSAFVLCVAGLAVRVLPPPRGSVVLPFARRLYRDVISRTRIARAGPPMTTPGRAIVATRLEFRDAREVVSKPVERTGPNTRYAWCGEPSVTRGLSAPAILRYAAMRRCVPNLPCWPCSLAPMYCYRIVWRRVDEAGCQSKYAEPALGRSRAGSPARSPGAGRRELGDRSGPHGVESL